MKMQRTGNDDSIQLLIEKLAMIFQFANAGGVLFSFVESAWVDVGDSNQFSILHRQDLLQKFLAARAYADHADTNAIVRAEDSSWSSR
jgi:hypothetical protein